LWTCKTDRVGCAEASVNSMMW